MRIPILRIMRWEFDSWRSYRITIILSIVFRTMILLKDIIPWSNLAAGDFPMYNTRSKMQGETTAFKWTIGEYVAGTNSLKYFFFCYEAL